VLLLDRTLTARNRPLSNKSSDEGKHINDMTRLTSDEVLTYNYDVVAARTITAQIGGLLKTPKPPGVQIDLSSTWFQDGDWKGIDFDGANLDNIWLSEMDLRDAELKGVTHFNAAYLNRTAWWEVRSIDRPLLEYLRTNYPFRLGQSYGPQNQVSSQEECDAAITRLTSQLK
jgi:hypothetical protein